MGKKYPLRDLACAASPGLRSGLCGAWAPASEKMRVAPAFDGSGDLGLRRADVKDVFNHVGAHAGKEKPAQEWIDADLAGTRDFSQEGNDAGAEFAQIAGKLIGPRQILQFSAAREYVETKLATVQREAGQIRRRSAPWPAPYRGRSRSESERAASRWGA